MIVGLREAGDRVGKPHVEGRVVAIELEDLAHQLVLLELQHKGKRHLVLEIAQIELGHHVMGDPVVKPVDRRFQPLGDDLFRQPQLVQHSDGGRVV